MGSETNGRRQTTPNDKNRWIRFNSRRGTGLEPFAQRLSRARLLFLRRRETAANWLALTLALALCSLLTWANVSYATALDGELNSLKLVTCFPFDAARPGGPLRFEVTARPASIVSRAMSVVVRQRNLHEQRTESEVTILTKKVMT